VEFEIGDGAGRRADVLPVHTAHNTNQRSCSGEDVVNFGFLIGNFWPIALNKTDIVCTRIQAQLPEPSCIKYLIRGDFTPLRPFLVEIALRDLSLQAHGQEFLQLTASQQLDLLTSSSTGQPGNPLRKFFEITRAQAVRAYYTSAAGLKELDYKGNAYYGDAPGCEPKS
jgi:hypothetical protein